MENNPGSNLTLSSDRMQREEQRRQEYYKKKKEERKDEDWLWWQKWHQQYYSNMSFPQGFVKGFTDTSTSQNIQTMVDTLKLIRHHRRMAIPMVASVPNIETQEVPDPVKPTRQYSSPFTVTSHPRRLADGKHASPEKKATAAENGFGGMPDGTTWVRSHTKGQQ